MNDLAQAFMKNNYYYCYLKGRLEKAADAGFSDGTLVVGSSHGLCGIDESVIGSAVNCSMHSQDIYYDYKCIEFVLEQSKNDKSFNRCILVMGYYIPYQDLSLSKRARTEMISRTYYPIFQDAHNWVDAVAFDHWYFNTGVNEEIRKDIEQKAIDLSKKYPFYLDGIMQRKPLYDFGGKTWEELELIQRENYGHMRADVHNSIEQHKDSYIENQKITQDLVWLLKKYDVEPIVVITPFTEEYCNCISETMKRGLYKMMNSVGIETIYDFNQDKYRGIFDASCFIDTDHLNEKGSVIFSKLLNRHITQGGKA